MSHVATNDLAAFARVEEIVNQPIMNASGEPVGSFAGDAMMGSTPVRGGMLVVNLAYNTNRCPADLKPRLLSPGGTDEGRLIEWSELQPRQHVVTAYANLIAYKIKDQDKGDKMVAELLLQELIVQDFSLEGIVPLPKLSPKKRFGGTDVSPRKKYGI